MDERSKEMLAMGFVWTVVHQHIVLIAKCSFVGRDDDAFQHVGAAVLPPLELFCCGQRILVWNLGGDPHVGAVGQ